MISTEIITAMIPAFKTLLRMSVSSVWVILAVIVLRLVLWRAPKQVRVLMWSLPMVRLILPFSVESRFSVTPDPAKLIPSSFAATVLPVTENLYVFALIWLTVMAAMLIYMPLSFLRLRLRVRASLFLRDSIYLCDQIDSPFVLGLIRPKIYVPSDMDNKSLDYVIMHEQAHIRRHDTLWKPLAFLLVCLHWFNPLVWAAYVLFTRDIELACDERAIKALPFSERKEYSTVLLECSTNKYIFAACPFAFGEKPIKQRIKSVLNYKKPKLIYKAAAVVCCAAATLLFLTNPVTAKVARDNRTVVTDPLNNLWYEPPTTEPVTEATAEKSTEAITEALAEQSAEDSETENEESYYEVEEYDYYDPEENDSIKSDNNNSNDSDTVGDADSGNGFFEITPFNYDPSEYVIEYGEQFGAPSVQRNNSWNPDIDANGNSVFQWDLN